jgi:hypothetical protein
VIAQLRDSTAELVKANLISWEADHACCCALKIDPFSRVVRAEN